MPCHADALPVDSLVTSVQEWCLGITLRMMIGTGLDANTHPEGGLWKSQQYVRSVFMRGARYWAHAMCTWKCMYVCLYVDLHADICICRSCVCVIVCDEWPSGSLAGWGDLYACNTRVFPSHMVVIVYVWKGPAGKG